jgi:hypothetical protein
MSKISTSSPTLNEFSWSSANTWIRELSAAALHRAAADALSSAVTGVVKDRSVDMRGAYSKKKSISKFFDIDLIGLFSVLIWRRDYLP